MTNILALSKVLIKNTINSIYKNNKLNMRTVGLVAIIVASFLPIIVNLTNFLTKGYDALAQIQQEGILLSLGIISSGFIIFFLGLFYIIGIFYFSNDIETLLPLPLKPYEIISSKFAVVLIYEYITALMVLAPIFAVYGYKSGAGFIYYVLALLTFLFLPVVPLVIGSIIVMIIMRFSNIAKNKDVFRLAGGIIAIVLAIGLNVVIQKNMTKFLSNPELLQSLLAEGNNSFVRIYTSVFPGLNFAASALIRSSTVTGLIHFVFFILITLVLFLGFLFIAEKMYFKGVLGVSEIGSKKRRLSKEQLRKGTIQNNAIFSYTLKELRLLFRTPIYFLNCVLMSFILPLILLIPAITQENGLSSIRDFIQGNSVAVVLTFGFSIALLFTSFNAVTATSISREGHNYYIGKYIPVSYGVQIASKVLSGVILGLLGTITTVFGALILLELKIYIALLIIIISIFGVAFSAMAGMAIDLFNPKLIWDSEQKAVKQNLNVIFHMIIGVAFAGATVFIVWKFNLGLGITIVGLIASYSILNFLMYKFLNTTGVKLYSEIND